MKATRYGHQGDIEILHLGKTTPIELEWCAECAPGDTIVAHGEVTGHAHRIVGQSVRFFRAPDGMTAFAYLEGPAELVHEEHARHMLAPGWTRFQRQREASLEDAGWLPVLD